MGAYRVCPQVLVTSHADLRLVAIQQEPTNPGQVYNFSKSEDPQRPPDGSSIRNYEPKWKV